MIRDGGEAVLRVRGAVRCGRAHEGALQMLIAFCAPVEATPITSK